MTNPVNVPVPETEATVPASTVSYTIPLADSLARLAAANYTATLVVTPPPPPPPPPVNSVIATAEPFGIKVAVSYTPAAGKTVVSYSAKGNGSAALMQGSDSLPTFFVQGVGGTWPGGAMTLAISVKLSDGSTVSLGNTNSVTLQATNGSILPPDGVMYANGSMKGKGDFDFGGAIASYYAQDADGVHVRVVQTTGGGGWQPYWPVTAAQGMDPTKHTNFVFVVKPDVDMAFLVSCMSNGDAQDGVGVTTQIAKAGVVTTITEPVSAFKFTKPLLKFSTGSSTHTANNIGFNVYSAAFV